MPPQLVERISASLAAERDRHPLPGDGADVQPLVGSRLGSSSSASESSAASSTSSAAHSRTSTGRSSRGWLLGLSGVAAAAAVGGVVVINALGPTGTAADPVAQAQFRFGAGSAPASPSTDSAAPSASPSASSSASPSASESAASPAQTANPGSVTGALSAAQVHVQLSSTQYSDAHLSEQAAALWRSPQPPLRALSAESTAIGPIGTPLGVSQCLSALGVSGVSRAVVDLAVYDGAPAAVVVTDGADGRDVRVVNRQCGAASTSVLAGPLTLR